MTMIYFRSIINGHRTPVATVVLVCLIPICCSQNGSTTVPAVPVDASFPYPLNKCICELDSTLRTVVKDELEAAANSTSATSRRKRAATVGQMSDYFVPPNLYHGVFYNSTTTPKLCQCIVENVLATKLNLKNIPWDENLADPNSEEFKALSAELQQAFDGVFNAGSFSSNYVLSFLTKLERAADNSTMATVDVQCSSQLDPELVRQSFFRASRFGSRMGLFAIDPPFFAAVQESSSKLDEDGLDEMLAKAEEIAANSATPVSDQSLKYFYYVTCPAFAGMGFLLFCCLCGLRERGYCCRDVTTK